MSKEIVIGLHGYQPPRNAYHEMFEQVPTDPNNCDWTQDADKKCYAKLASSDVLAKVSYDFNGVLIDELQRRESTTVDIISKYKDTVIGTPYIHPILPDLSDSDKRIVIGAGVLQHQSDFKTTPSVFWPPETAMDSSTAEILADFGYEAFICAPNQIQLASGEDPSNVVTKITLPSGRSIVAIPYDREVASNIAFKDKHNAPSFAREQVDKPFSYLQQRGKNLMIVWTDMETFGLHWPNGDAFLRHLVEQDLPELGFEVVNVNRLDLTQAIGGKLHERSSWSCHCGGLPRWSRGCGCSPSPHGWKEVYYKTFEELNDSVSEIAQANLPDYQETMIVNFREGLRNTGGSANTPKDSLIAAKVASLVARTSCATFFDEPHTSGHINILFGLVAIQHLRDAGLEKEAREIENQFLYNLSRMTDPTKPDQTGKDMVDALLVYSLANAAA